MLVEVGFYWAVPIFLMLSGATLMNYREKYSTKTFFSKRLSRVVFPWIFWSFVMLTQKVIEGQYTLESCRPKAVLSILLNCEIENTQNKLKEYYLKNGNLYQLKITDQIINKIEKMYIKDSSIWTEYIKNLHIIYCKYWMGNI